MKHNMATETEIIEIDQREPNNQGYKGRIHPSESEEEECMEPASKKDPLPREPNTEEIRELLPEFNGSSALSLLEAKDTWERILVKAGIHRNLWGGIVLGKLKGEALLNLQPSNMRDQKFEEICESLESIFGGTTKTSYNIVKSHVATGVDKQRNGTTDIVMDPAIPEMKVIYEFQDDFIFNDQIVTHREDNIEKERDHDTDHQQQRFERFIDTDDIFSYLVYLVTKTDEVE